MPPGGRGNAISAAAATPGYLPGRIERGRWQVILGPYTVAPQGLSYTVSGTLRFGRPGTDVHALELAGAGNHDRDAGTLLDPTARAAYRRIPAELTAAARAAGLDFIISTEHNTLSASLQWGEHAGADLLIVNGEEVTTPVRTLAGVEPSGGQVDRLALPGGRPPGAAPVRRRGASGRWICRRCASVRVVLGLLVGVRLRAGRFVEVWNGPWTLDDEAAVMSWHGMLRAGARVPAVGNSDAHNPDHVVGLPHNVVLAEELSPRRLMDGFKAGRNWIAESAQLQLTFEATDGLRLAGIGQALTTATGTPVTIELTVSGVPGTSVRLLDQSGPQWIQPVDASGSATVRWTTQTRYSRWVRSEVRRPVPTATTPDSMLALTNPVFLSRAEACRCASFHVSKLFVQSALLVLDDHCDPFRVLTSCRTYPSGRP